MQDTQHLAKDWDTQAIRQGSNGHYIPVTLTRKKASLLLSHVRPFTACTEGTLMDKDNSYPYSGFTNDVFNC
jgi:hypothetical protein